jgi:dienelactone hydrolase
VRLFRLLAIIVALAGLTLVTRPYLHGLSFAVRAADVQGTARRFADLDAVAVREREVPIEMPQGSMRARIYEPEGRSVRTALLVPAFHPSGVDEPGLMRLARLLAARRLTVVTPDIPELRRFELSPALTDAVERAALWLARDSELASNHQIALFGVSFSGGLSIVAAGRPSLANHISHVFALGAHDDLPRVLKYLCTGQEPFLPGQARIALNAAGAGSAANAAQPFTRAPHQYGLLVTLLGVADRVAPAAQVDALREAVRQFLSASALAGRSDAAELDALKGRVSKMPEPSKTLMRYIIDRDVVHLGARLLPYINGYASAPAMSVSKSPKPNAPVFLLHDPDDSVIPSVESEYLAEDLRGHATVRRLVSPLAQSVAREVSAEPDRSARAGEVLQLASFWGDLLSR